MNEILELGKLAEDKLKELSKKYPDREGLSSLSFEDENIARFCLDIRKAYGEAINRIIRYDAEMERQKEKAVN